MDNPDEGAQKRAVEMALTAAIREDQKLGGIIEDFNRKDPYRRAGRFNRTLAEGILVPQESTQYAMDLMRKTLIRNHILPEEGFRLNELSTANPPPYVGRVVLAPIGIEIPDLNKVNVPEARRFVMEIESKPATSKATLASRAPWN